MFLILPVQANVVLEGGVKYNVESAKNEVEQNPIAPPNSFLIQNNFIDANYAQNIAYLLKGQIDLKDRELAFFSDNTYGVVYKKNKLEVFYYRPDGQLMAVELRSALEYPYKAYKYDVNRQLINKSLRVSKGETFIYTPDGELIAHWLNNYGYDVNGKIIMMRKYID